MTPLTRFDYETSRQLREAAGLSREEVALAVGRSNQTIAAWETGRTRPPIPQVRGLCEVYGCDESALIKADTVAEQRRKDQVRKSRIASRRAQGLPDGIEDESAIEDAARLLSKSSVTQAQIDAYVVRALAAAEAQGKGRTASDEQLEVVASIHAAHLRDKAMQRQSGK
jgi:transcriptional regulator with XRE-family HTH domain